MTKRQNTAIFATILLAAGAAYVLLMHAPQTRRLAEARDRLARVRQQYEQDADKARTIPQLQAEVERLKGEFHNFDRRLPGQQELGEFLREISSTGEAGHLTNQVIKPGNPSSGSLYNRLPILIDFRCSFDELVQFLGRLNDMTRLTQVEQIQMTPVAEGEQMLDVHMQVNIYFTRT
ncbi:MAG: type 4a pilus biogenesis protein PilO [Planctomycetes bacterium]|nr:type 4a pilus biogenesis protein PilO [Planctomycetota bacterium]